MCGIAGIYGTEKMVDSNAIIAAMTDSMNHRGPDAEGHFTDENLVLGHRRLSIIDLNEKSNQPFHSNNGRYTLVFNGEIYNYRELKESLTDYSFTTDSDTEVFVAAFEKWAPKPSNSSMECLPQLFGIDWTGIYIWSETGWVLNPCIIINQKLPYSSPPSLDRF